MNLLARIEAPHFVAGLILGPSKKVVKAAPIIRYMIGWDNWKVFNYCQRKGWKIERVTLYS